MSLSFVSALTIDVPSATNDDGIEAEITFSDDANYYKYIIATDADEDDCESLGLIGPRTMDHNVFGLLDGDPVNGTTYTIIVCEDDDTNIHNGFDSGSETIIYDLNAPTSPSIVISDNSGYTNDATPTLTLSATDSLSDLGEMAFSCDGNNWSSYVTYTTNYDSFNMTTSTGCTTTNGTKTIYAKFKDNAGNESASVSDSTSYDSSAPDEPEGLEVESVDDEEVNLAFDEAEDNDVVSVKIEYGLDDDDFDETKTIDYDEDELTATISNLDNGEKYYFRIRFIDRAGNESSASDEVSATPESVSTTISVKKDNKELNYTKKGDKISISCSFSESVEDAKIYAKYDSKSTQTIKSSSSSVSSISETMTIEEDYEKIQVWCDAEGTISTKKTITIDNQLPTIEWSDTNNICSLIKKLMVKATDNTSIKKVEFVINNVTHSTTKKDNNYYLDFNTQTLENGDYAIKAIAYDEAENTKEITRNITISNILSETQICQKLITEAKAKKKIIEDIIKYLQEQGIEINLDILNKKKTADDSLSQAESKITSNANDATKKAEEAKTIYDEINTKLANETKEAKIYEKKEGAVKSILQGKGFSEELSNAGEEGSKNNERKLKIIKVGEEYHAVIELTIKNDTNSNSIKVIEIIPKELIEKASEIYSDQNFIILEEDPTIEFNLNIAPGETKTISYGVGAITKEKSEELITKEIINNFASGPINLDEEVETKKVFESSNLSGLIFIGGIVILILLIIAGIIIGGTILFKQNHGFGGEKTPTETKQVEIELKKEESWPKNPQ